MQMRIYIYGGCCCAIASPISITRFRRSSCEIVVGPSIRAEERHRQHLEALMLRTGRPRLENIVRSPTPPVRSSSTVQQQRQGERAIDNASFEATYSNSRSRSGSIQARAVVSIARRLRGRVLATLRLASGELDRLRASVAGTSTVREVSDERSCRLVAIHRAVVNPESERLRGRNTVNARIAEE